MNIIFKISWRYLFGKRKQMFISFVSWISIGGVALGVTTLIVTLSIMNGFQKDLKKKILTANPHIMVLDVFNSGFNDFPEVINSLKSIKDIVAVSPFVYGQGLLKKQRSAGTVIKGIEENEKKVTQIDTYIKLGKMFTPGSKEIVIGSELAKNIGASTGDEIIFIAPSEDISAFGKIPRWQKFIVSGIFEVGMFEYDSSLAYIDIKQAQKLFELEDKVSSVGIRIKDPEKADQIASKIESKLSKHFWARSWMRLNKNLFSAIKLEKIVMFIILIFIIIVAAFGIISSLIMTTMEKIRDIGILKSMGFTKKNIAKIFILQGFLIGVIGSGIGLFLGLGISFALDQYKFIKLPADVYYISSVPIYIRPLEVCIIALTAILISLVATLYPAKKAANLEPSVAIKYE